MQRTIGTQALRAMAAAVALAGCGLAGSLLFGRQAYARGTVPLTAASSARTLGALPLFFVESPGTGGSAGHFTAAAGGLGIRVDAQETSLVIFSEKAAPKGVTSHVITSRLIGGNPAAVTRGEKQLPARISRFTGSDPKGWRTNLRAFEKVRTLDAYEGIDLVHYGRDNSLEYDFVLKPGARPDAIRMAIDGAEEVAINPSGDLEIETSLGTLVQKRPVCYQERSGERVETPGRFVLAKNEPSRDLPATVGFLVDDYDRSLPLVIDPVLQYSTYLGGSSTDDLFGVDTDSRGRIHVAGSTLSPDFPTTSGRVRGDQPTQDAFYAVIDPSRSGAASLIYGSYIGGNHYDFALDVAVDGDGRAHLTGTTLSSDFPLTSGAFQTAPNGLESFITVLNPDRSGAASLVFSSYLGGSGTDQGSSIDIDGLGRAHLTGLTTSTDFPVSTGAVQNAFGGAQDAYVAIISAGDNGGGSIVYATYLGGSGGETPFAITADSSGRSYVTGYTTSGDFPTTASRLGGRIPPYYDAFVSAIDPAQGGPSGLTYSTYLSGSGEDGGRGIAVDEEGLIYVVGVTYSSDYPTTVNRFQGDVPDADAILTVLDPTKPGVAALVYSTYLGGAGGEGGEDIALLDTGAALIVGTTGSSDFPITPGALQTERTKDEGFVTLIDPRKPGAASLLYSTFLGGGERDWCTSTTIDRLSRACVAGLTDSVDFPTTAARFQTDPGDRNTDGFLTVLDFLLEPPTNLSAVLAGTNFVRLTWSDNSFAEAGFQIERRTSTTAFVPIDEVGTDVTTFTDTSVAPNTIYTYRVRAVRTGRVTAYANIATATTPRAVGGTLEVPDEVNFGRVKRRKEKRATVTIRNTHPSETLTGVVGATTRGFKVVEGGGGFSLIPGQSQDVILAAKSARRGALRGTLSIESSDPVRPVVEVMLKARVR